MTVRFSRAVTPIPLDTSSMSGYDICEKSYLVKSSLSSKSVEYLPATNSLSAGKFFQYNNLNNDPAIHHYGGIIPNFVNRLASSYRQHNGNAFNVGSHHLLPCTTMPLKKQSSSSALEIKQTQPLQAIASMNSVAITLNSDDGCSTPDEDLIMLQKEEQKENEVINVEDKTDITSFSAVNPDDIFI